MKRALVVLLGFLFGSCKSNNQTPSDMGDGEVQYPGLSISSVNTRAVVADQMRAAVEMQESGEPLGTIMGRIVANYVHYDPVPDQYQVKTPTSTNYVIDPVGYSVAVESYEYSKMAMNHLSFESGAGLSLMYGPRLNPFAQSGSVALGLLRDRIQALAIASRAGSTGPVSPWVVVPAPTDNPLNPLGWPGLWPQFAEFRSYDPTIMASPDATARCTNTGANGGVYSISGYGGNGQFLISNYECSDNTLHLVNRDSQVEKVLQIDALGLSAWKQALWCINYFQIVHDVNGAQWSNVAAADLAQVGQPGNTVQANNGDPSMPGQAGTYIGSSDLEGFQGLTMAEELDNKAEFLLTQLSTSDGMTLSGFPNLAAALNYDYTTPLHYFPHAIAVTEQPGTGGAESQPTGFTLKDNSSQLPDLTALLGGYAEVFALTDANNSQVGGAPPALVIFDGDPFPADNGLPDGEATLHDRALAVIKVALVNLDRLHLDPKSGALCDTAQLAQGSGKSLTLSRSTHATTVEVVYALVALRALYRSLTSQLTLYSDATPDHASLHSALDGTSMAGVPGGTTVAGRISQLLLMQATFLSSHLVDATGLAANGYDVGTNTPDPMPTTLESQAATVRGLLEAYLITSQVAYRNQAIQAFDVLESRFFDPNLRVYRPNLNEMSNFVFTPPRFGILQSALRQMYVQVAARPGNDAMRADLETRIGRLNKLILNGWDDRNGNNKVDYPNECMSVKLGLPQAGLQMAERSLTGEIGAYRNVPYSDYDNDCVPNLAYVNLPPILASQVLLVPAN